ncbi:MAG: chitobiase/beta-hexosaminidase C-terminal domain-containing protein [Bacteroidales bacterium]|nr:chitobiase/beta-hexosaminidase C-terminal domain-containing protein [Bacteroidales bacterium]
MNKRFLTAMLVALLSVAAYAQTDGEAEKRSATEWDDVEVYEQNRLYPRVNVIPYDDENDIEKWNYFQSSSYILLDEGWVVDYTNDFADRVSEIEKRDFSPKDWQSLVFPDVRWSLGGRVLRMPTVGKGGVIPETGNATATLHTEIDVPKEWSEYDVFFQIQPLSACYVWVNRAYVGYAEDGRSLAEFDITSRLIPGKKNTITLQMVSLSTSNLLEMNRDPRHLGMAVEPALLLKTAANVQDFALRADYKNGTGVLAVDFNMANRARKGRYYVEIELWNPLGRQVDKMGRWFAFDKKSEMPVSVERDFENVMPWTAETPNLYTLVVRLLDEKMNLVETVGTRFGFRTVEVRDGLLTVNGVPVTLRGVVYSDYTFDDDGVVDYDIVEADMKVLKNNNVNAIRTAVYSPADPHFYELCDKYGFYVVCDANIHPYSTQSKAIATDNAYSDLFVSRVQNMYERYKNHTSIIAWSLGESPDNGTCMMSAFKQLKMKDRTRPVIFAGAGYGDNTDIIALQNASIDQVRQYMGRMQSRPLVLLSYGSCEGNNMGGLEQLWELVEDNENVQGGFFSQWNDVRYVSSGSEVVRHGLLSPQRGASPALSELAYIYRPYDVALRTFSIDAGEFAISNRCDFLSSSDLRLEYSIFTSLKPAIISGEVPKLPDAGGDRVFKLMIPRLTLYAGEEMFIRFSLRQRRNVGAVSKGTELYSVQFVIPMDKVEAYPLSFDYCQPLVVVEKRAEDSLKTLQAIAVAGDYGTTTIDMRRGEITSYQFHGTELLKSPIRLNFWRVPTDNDRSDGSVAKQWQMLRPDLVRREVSDITYTKVDNNSVSVDMMVRYVNTAGVTLMDVRQTLLLLATGDILMSSDLMLSETVKSLPRVGLQMVVDKRFDTVQWMGSDIESYFDRRGAMRLGSHTQPAQSLFHRYMRPQEAGSRLDTRWLSLAKDDVALFVNMIDTSFSFSVYPYDDMEMSRAKSFSKLRTIDGWTLNVDARMSGVGSALGGIDIASDALVSGHKHHFAVHLCGYSPADFSPFDFCRIAYPEVSSNVLEMPRIERDRERFDGPLTITITSPDEGAEIYYTLDGSDPSMSSIRYDKPFVIENTTVIKARAFRKGDAPSFTSQLRCDYAYLSSVAYDKKPNTPYNRNSARALFDGEMGDVSDLSEGWIGFSGGDCGATFQLARQLDVEQVSLRFAHNPDAWIFAPKQVWVYLSYDGSTFTDSISAPITYNPELKDEAVATVYAVDVKVNRQAVRAVRVVAHGIGRIPEWHRAKGLKPWLMIDEVTVKETLKQ